VSASAAQYPPTTGLPLATALTHPRSMTSPPDAGKLKRKADGDLAPDAGRLKRMMKDESGQGKHTYLARRQINDWIKKGWLEPDGDLVEQTKLFLSLKKLVGDESNRVSIDMFKSSQRLHLVSVWPKLLDSCRIAAFETLTSI